MSAEKNAKESTKPGRKKGKIKGIPLGPESERINVIFTGAGMIFN